MFLSLDKKQNGCYPVEAIMAKEKRLPSGKFEIYPTDMNNGSGLLRHEDFGINPDVILRDYKDWMEQAVEITQKK